MKKLKKKLAVFAKQYVALFIVFFLFLRTLHRVVENITVEKKKGEKMLGPALKSRTKNVKSKTSPLFEVLDEVPKNTAV